MTPDPGWLMSEAGQRLLSDVHFFQSSEGLLVGTVLLVALWLLLTLVERYGRRIRPMITGLSAALYLGWITHAVSGAAPALMPLKGLETSTALILITLGWASVSVGQSSPACWS